MWRRGENKIIKRNLLHITSRHTCVLYCACTLLFILSISRTVSSLPCFISNSFQVAQNLGATCQVNIFEH